MVGDEADGPNRGWLVRPHRGSVIGFVTAKLALDRHTEQHDADNRDGDPVQNQPSRDWCSVHDKGSSFGTLADESAAGWLPFKIAEVTSGERNASRRA